MGKTCCTCHNAKPLEDFNLRRTSKDGRQDRCRQCQKDWYAANSARHKQNTSRHRKKYIARNRKYIWDYLKTHPCVDCGETEPAVLDFDHVRDKKINNISEMMGTGFSYKTLTAEVRKCEVRCANCHRRKTARQQGWYAWVSEMSHELKSYGYIPSVF